MGGVYLHIPYCRRKCFYCDFYSLGARRAPWGPLVDALLAELEARRPRAGEVATIYIGGGTPSQMPVGELARLLDGLAPLRPVREMTVEVNPEDVTPELCRTLRAGGVDRVSMGVQSFNDAELRAIGRRHTARQVLDAYALLRHTFDNISIDLIFGLPGQTLASWRETVERAVGLRPEHLSAYSLMWEPGTALCAMRRQGRTSPVPDETAEAMYLYLSEAAARAGYEHYETSNYALPGRRSIHNSSYWDGTPYLGLGPGAHSYDGARTRRANPADAAAYIRHFTSHATAPFYTEEHLSEREVHEEYVMTRLRRREGIDLRDYGARFGAKSLEALLRRAAPYIEGGDMVKSDSALSIAPRAVLRSDPVIVALM